MKRKPKFIEYGKPFDSHGYRGVRFVEHPEDGLRFVGFADKIVSFIEHTGWYTVDEGWNGEPFRGVVYRLPAGRGFVPGYVHVGCSDDDGAILAFGEIEETERDAAIAADRFAETEAEHERGYHRAWDAGRRVEQIDEEIAESRRTALALGDEMRLARKLVTNAPTICTVLRAQILGIWRDIQKLRKERKSLFSDYGRQPGFVE